MKQDSLCNILWEKVASFARDWMVWPDLIIEVSHILSTGDSMTKLEFQAYFQMEFSRDKRRRTNKS